MNTVSIVTGWYYKYIGDIHNYFKTFTTDSSGGASTLFFFTVPRSITPPFPCLSYGFSFVYFCYMYICHIQHYIHKHMHQKAFWPIILVALVFLKVGHLHAKLPWLSIVLSIASVFLNDIFPILSIIQILVFLYQLL